MNRRGRSALQPGPIGSEHDAERRNGLDQMPSLFELLLRTLHRHPQRLDDIAVLLKKRPELG